MIHVRIHRDVARVASDKLLGGEGLGARPEALACIEDATLLDAHVAVALQMIPAAGTEASASSALLSVALEGDASMRDDDLTCFVAAATIEREGLILLLCLDGALALCLLEG